MLLSLKALFLASQSHSLCCRRYADVKDDPLAYGIKWAGVKSVNRALEKTLRSYAEASTHHHHHHHHHRDTLA